MEVSTCSLAAMYPFNVVLIGVNESLMPVVGRELLLHKVKKEAEFPDVLSAVDGLAGTKDEMRLFVYHAKSAEEVSRIKKLGGSFLGKPILVFMNGENDGKSYLKAMRAGATQIVPLPLQADDFHSALECISLQFGSPSVHSRVIAVSGVTGGCGATALSINLAHAMVNLYRKRTILVELTRQVGILKTYMNLEPRFTIRHVLKNIANLDAHMVQQALTRGPENLDVLAGPDAGGKLVEMAPGDVARVVDFTKHLADVVILDLPCTYDENYFSMASSADEVVLVMEQKVSSVRNVKLILDTIEQSTVLRAHYVVVNRYDPKVRGFTIPELQDILKIPNLVPIASDYVSVNRALNLGYSLRLEAPHSRVLKDIDALAAMLLSLEPPPQIDSEKPSLFARLARGMGLFQNSTNENAAEED